MDWIKIEDHLPQIDFEVLVCVDDDVFLDVYRVGNVDGEYWFDSEQEGGKEITHWQPKPDPAI